MGIFTTAKNNLDILIHWKLTWLNINVPLYPFYIIMQAAITL